jgi:RNA recognition motif-containing protein
MHSFETALHFLPFIFLIEKPGRMKIFVGNLSFLTVDDTLSEVFSEFGQVSDCYIPRDTDSNNSRGFGFVTMERNAGGDAIDALDGCELDGRIISVNEAKPRAATKPEDSEDEEDTSIKDEEESSP